MSWRRVFYAFFVIAVAGISALAGLQEGDIITRVGDITLDETHSYLNALFNYKPGDQVTLVFLRNGSQAQVPVTLGEAQHQ